MASVLGVDLKERTRDPLEPLAANLEQRQSSWSEPDSACLGSMIAAFFVSPEQEVEKAPEDHGSTDQPWIAKLKSGSWVSPGEQFLPTS